MLLLRASPFDGAGAWAPNARSWVRDEWRQLLAILSCETLCPLGLWGCPMWLVTSSFMFVLKQKSPEYASMLCLQACRWWRGESFCRWSWCSLKRVLSLLVRGSTWVNWCQLWWCKNYWEACVVLTPASPARFVLFLFVPICSFRITTCQGCDWCAGHPVAAGTLVAWQHYSNQFYNVLHRPYTFSCWRLLKVCAKVGRLLPALVQHGHLPCFAGTSFLRQSCSSSQSMQRFSAERFHRLQMIYSNHLKRTQMDIR